MTICLWLSAPDPSTGYNKALTERHGGTGLWFVRSQTFDDCRAGPNSFVWVHGFPGCGKTILSSTTIEEILKLYPSPTVAVLYCSLTLMTLKNSGTTKCYARSSGSSSCSVEGSLKHLYHCTLTTGILCPLIGGYLGLNERFDGPGNHCSHGPERIFDFIC